VTKQSEELDKTEAKYHLGVSLFGITVGTICLVIGAVIGPVFLRLYDSETNSVSEFVTYGLWVAFPTITSYLIALTSLVLKWPRWRIGVVVIIASVVLAYGLFICWTTISLYRISITNLGL
jgi:phosphotransferase system  glucose/maltose/N-acetylglucosamine-specific IIC component